MKSAGEILKSAREKKKLTRSQLCTQTAIAEKYIHAIEQNSFDQLPNDVATRGFLSLYAQAVDLDAKTIVALYRRDVPTQNESHPTLHAHFFVFGHAKLFRFVTSAIVTGVAIGFCIFAAVFLSRLRQAPPLRILAPQNEAHAISPVFIRGETSSDAVVQIDGEAIGVNQDGVFTKDVDLDPGLHVLTIKAVGRNGKERMSQLVVTVDEGK